LATYIGWLMHRTVGGLIAGGLFILPGIISILALSYIYAAYGKVGFVVALFFGLKAAVLAIVLEAVVRVGKRALQNGVMIALAAFVGARLHPRLFEVSGGHDQKKNEEMGPVDSLLSEKLPDHARPSVGRSLGVSAIWLALWLVPVVTLLLTLGSGNVFSEIA